MDDDDDDDYDVSNDEGDVQVVYSPKLYRSNTALFKNGVNVDSLLQQELKEKIWNSICKKLKKPLQILKNSLQITASVH